MTRPAMLRSCERRLIHTQIVAHQGACVRKRESKTFVDKIEARSVAENVQRSERA
jgi:hypothetical protein